jgi:FixJ family two-component response regulator
MVALSRAVGIARFFSRGRDMAVHSDSQPIVFVLDGHPDAREDIQALLETVHIKSRDFACARDFSGSELPDVPHCLICEVRMPNANGLDLQDELRQRGSKLPIIFITGYGDIPMAVRAMKAGASDFLTKPFRGQDLLDAITSALARDRQRHEADAKLRAVKARVAALTPRQRTCFTCGPRG